MNRLFLAALAILAAATWGIAQNVTMPPPAGTVAVLCAYNSSPATITTANVGFINCDVNGNVKTVASGTPSGTQDVNLKQVGGATVQQGHGVAASAIRVELPTDGTGIVGLIPGTTIAVPSVATGGASFLRIAAGQATTIVKASPGTLYSICLNSAATATNTTNIYDNVSSVGLVIGTPAVTTATVPTCLTYGPAGLAFANGLTIITAAANGGDMTVTYK